MGPMFRHRSSLSRPASSRDCWAAAPTGAAIRKARAARILDVRNIRSSRRGGCGSEEHTSRSAICNRRSAIRRFLPPILTGCQLVEVRRSLPQVGRPILSPSQELAVMRAFRFSRSVSTVAATVLAYAAPLPAQQVTADALKPLTFRHIGPVGNRVASVAGVVGDPLTYYAGAATGGVWKSTDGGIVWRPVFDKQDVSAAGAIAVSMSDPSVVWVGTGEPHIRSNVTVGDGVYKSTDAGETWTNMGLKATGRISRVVIHPTNPDVVFIAALGHAHGPQKERGIYRTKDAGKTWEQVLFVNENTGASSLVQ